MKRTTTERVTGGRADDFLVGGVGNDAILGRQGSDTLIGGQGDDQLSGGAGLDKFVLNSWDGQDVIADYELGETLAFRSGGYSGPDHYLADGETFTTATGHTFLAYNDTAGNARLLMMENNYHGDSFTLVGVSVTQIYTGWLEFL
jgi:Ca2+-binding RTX toxin-like protein